MYILPLSNSINLQSYKGSSLIKFKRAFKFNVASSTSFKGNSKVNPSFIIDDDSHQILSNRRPMFQDPKELVIGQSLVNGPYHKEPMDEELEQEIGSIIQKLTRAMERVREKEMKKCFCKRKEAAEIEDIVSVENMSKEIVTKLVEKPIQYLRSGNGNLKEKIRDVNLLIGMLESC